MIKVLSTKNLDEYLIDYAAALNLSIECLDFIETVPVAPDTTQPLTGNFDSVLFTSANAVRFFFENYPAEDIVTDKIIFALSSKTSDELLIHGIEPNFTAETATLLSQVILETKNVRSALHICGDKRLNIIQEKLLQSNIQYHQLIVYETLLNVDRKIENIYDVIMFYSPSGINAFFTSNSLKDKQVFCCIGDTTANALQAIKSDLNILVPGKIALESMIDKIAEYYKKQSVI